MQHLSDYLSPCTPPPEVPFTLRLYLLILTIPNSITSTLILQRIYITANCSSYCVWIIQNRNSVDCLLSRNCFYYLLLSSWIVWIFYFSITLINLSLSYRIYHHIIFHRTDLYLSTCLYYFVFCALSLFAQIRPNRI